MQETLQSTSTLPFSVSQRNGKGRLNYLHTISTLEYYSSHFLLHTHTYYHTIVVCERWLEEARLWAEKCLGGILLTTPFTARFLAGGESFSQRRDF